LDNRRTNKAMAALCLAVALTAGATAGAGLLLRGDGIAIQVMSERGESYLMAATGIYRFNSQRMVAEGVGWDIFTLFIAVPALLAALPSLARGTLRGRLFALGMLGYFFYQYLMYAMAWAFGPLFVPFVVIYAASLAGIAWIASTFELKELPARFGESFPARGMAIFSLAMALLLVAMWTGRIVPATAGKIDGMLLGQTTMVVQALDLGLIVPFSVFTGLAALKRRPIGYLLSAALVVKGAAMAGAICLMVISAWVVEGQQQAVPLAIFGAATGVSLWLGLRIYRSVRAAGAPA
jgi:hypothetical protein